MATKQRTDAELLVLGLVAEMPRHGYQLDQVIEERGMRQWTQIGFSSIYFVLGKLEKLGLVSARGAVGPNAKAKKTYAITRTGRRVLIAQTLSALREVRPTHSSVLLGMINWSVLQRNEAVAALRVRAGAIETEITRLSEIQVDQQPLPDFVDALFEYTLGQLRAEADWTRRTMEYMETKPWLD